MTARVPVIDIGALRSDDPAALRALADEIGSAARGIGFFSVVNHGIPADLIAAVFAQSAAFFAQNVQAKERVGIEQSPAYRGYARNGYEQFDEAHPADAKESFDVGPDQNLWPDDLPGFQPAVQAYYDALYALTLAIHRPIALDLGLDEHFFASAFDGAIAIARLLYYPPHPGAFDGTLHGAAPHTDYGNITFLAQDDAGGLELQMRDGTWIDVPPTPGAFVCNIGDCLMRWSNDVYVSTLHRVVNRSGRARYSIAFFGDPAAGARVECLPSCTSAAHPAKYPPTTYGEYLRRRLTAAYPEKAGLEAPARGG
jgi:isopenicillin N synthase-like dioxygenase